PNAVSDDPGELAEQRCLRLGTNDLLDDLAVLENAHGRDGHDLVPLRDRRVLVDVQLDYVDLVGVLAGDLLENRGDHPAGPAPFGPVVNDDRLAVLQDLRVKGLFGNALGRPHSDPTFRVVSVAMPSWAVWLTSRAPPATVRRRSRPHSRCPPR